MKNTIIITLFLLICSCKHDQNKSKVQSTAEAMLESLIEHNFEEYTKYVHPRILEQAGGRDKYIQELEISSENQKKQGDVVERVIVKDLSEMIECNGMLQCVLKQETTMSSVDTKSFAFASNLIGISKDKGETWYFVNVSDKGIKEIQQMYPEICDSIPLNIIQ